MAPFVGGLLCTHPRWVRLFRVGYRERLSVPAAWWVIGLFFSVSFVTAVGFALGPWVSLLGGLVVAVGIVAALWWYGSAEVVVDDRGLAAGDAVLEWAWMGGVTAHDAASTQHRLRTGADHRAFLFLRSYIRTSVEVAVDDPDDPHPYWLVSTRHPRQLAEAIGDRLSG